MPTFVHGKGTKVLIDEFDLSTYFTSVDVTQAIDTAETTTFSANSKSYIKGLEDGTISLSGLFAQDADGSDEELSAILGAATTPLVTIAFEAGTIGNRCVVAKAHETTYSISNPVADVSSVTADFNASSDAVANLLRSITTGVMLTTGSSIAYGDLGNLASVDNGASSTNGGTAILHVTANSVSGGATTIKVQHSADDSTWADLITFSAVSASTVTSEQKVVTGTINQYVRVTASTAGSSGAITFHTGFARF
jgi:hypothetical protein